MFKDVFNVLQGQRPEGGSTITQQVAKNILLNNEASVGRKLKEALVATRLEQSLTKKQILELYLNEIWLGYRSYGVGAAAYNYFGKSISDLTLAECAYLAALPKGPDNYQPVRQKAAAIRRRNVILQSMADLGWASRRTPTRPCAEDLKVEAAAAAANTMTPTISWKRRAARRFRSSPSATSWTRAATTCAPPWILACRPRRGSRSMDGLETYDHRHGWRGAWGQVAIAARAGSRPTLAKITARPSDATGGRRWSTRPAAPCGCSWPTASRGRTRRRRTWPGPAPARGWRWAI